MQEGEALRASASKASLTVQTVTALSGSGGISLSRGESDIRVEIAARPDEKRPGGRRFGALVHAMLAAVELNADGNEIQSVAALQQRVFNATPEEVKAAIQTVITAVRHPLLRRAAAAGKENVRREAPVLVTLEDGTIAEGVADLAFRENVGELSQWTVVDFKTDREFSDASARYIRQVQLYTDAVRAATALPATGLILVV
jgi:ATP-dependent exoDNAse (exonuclease V) beta subunit